METKNATIRIPVELANWLTSNNESLNQAIINAVTNLKRIRAVSLSEIKGLFTEQEWIFLADSLNGVLMIDMLRCNPSVLVANCEDAEKFGGTASRYGVDLKNLTNKISNLKGANIEAIYSRVETYWNNCDNIDLNEWAKF